MSRSVKNGGKGNNSLMGTKFPSRGMKKFLTQDSSCTILWICLMSFNFILQNSKIRYVFYHNWRKTSILLIHLLSPFKIGLLTCEGHRNSLVASRGSGVHCFWIRITALPPNRHVTFHESSNLPNSSFIYKIRIIALSA